MEERDVFIVSAVRTAMGVGKPGGALYEFLPVDLAAMIMREAVQRAEMELKDIKYIIPHQANKRIIEAAARGLDIPIERVVINVECYGNTSTASIPIATCEAVQDGRLQPNDKIVFVGFGAGLTWGAAVAKWTGPVSARVIIPPRSYRTWARVRSVLLRLTRYIEGLIWGRYLD